MRKCTTLWISIFLLVVFAACTRHMSAPQTPPDPPVHSIPVYQHVSVATQHNDNYRDGLINNELALTTSNENIHQFVRQFALKVDDQVYSQPLAVGKLSIAGGVHN